MRVCFVNCRRSRFAVSTAKSNKTATMENESLYLLVTNYVTCANVWIFFFFFLLQSSGHHAVHSNIVLFETRFMFSVS